MAGGAKFDDDDEGINEINVTPLVDIMLVLLIIFMVASNYIVQEAIEVDLPKAASGQESLSESVSVVLKTNGELYVNGELSSLDALAQKAKTLSEKDKDAQAMISADKAVPHGEVVKVIDLVRMNGLLKFAINIDPVDSVDEAIQPTQPSDPAQPAQPAQPTQPAQPAQ